ncbi:hypothetical protein LPJ61_005890 [Coemansia biformis]|uniref:Lysozyme-like protein n=1 Tax=Coemansia biformis TaxID=1286918 RepID=A0A9W7Y1G8_9FUNG|nr:hypothetical protein LPJ61_005890 [Coemansia biformis]
MVTLANVASLIAASMAVVPHTFLAEAQPTAQGTIIPKADGQFQAGDSCDITTDRVTCANASSLLMCSHDKWVVLSDCDPGTTCKNGIAPGSAAAPSSTDAAPGGGGGGGGSGGSNFGITCAKFNQAVSKASAAIGQSYPQPSAAQCQAFLQGMPKGDISSAREAAMFLANILWESDGLRAKEEYDCKDLPSWCAQNYKLPGDSPGKTYWGRGYIQLTWLYNYQAASRALFGNDKLVNDPTLASTDENVAWGVSFWYWAENVHSDAGVQAGNFGSSINKINGALECRGAAQDKAKKRYQMYTSILPIFAPGQTPKESGCYN